MAAAMFFAVVYTAALPYAFTPFELTKIDTPLMHAVASASRSPVRRDRVMMRPPSR